MSVDGTSNSAASPIRILLIEDDEEDYLLTQALLIEIEPGRFVLDWASNYDEGLARIRREEHDLYLVDYRLGRQTGIDLLDEIRPIGTDAPFIILTGERSHDTDLAAMQAGAADYLVKNRLEPAALERSIRYALDRRQAMQSLRESAERYRSLVEQMPAVLHMRGIDPASTPLFVSPHIKNLLGYSPEEWVAQPGRWLGSIHPADRERVIAERERASSSGDPFDIDYRMVNGEGQSIWVRDHTVLVRGMHDTPLYWQGIMFDISARKLAENRQQMLSDVSRLLAESLNLQATLEQVANVIVPAIADWCTLSLRDGDGSLYTTTGAHADPDKAALLIELIAQPVDLSAPLGLPLDTRSRETLFYRETPPEALLTPTSPAYLTCLHALGLRSVVSVPLVAHERTLGSIVLIYGDSGRHYTEQDVEFAEQVASRVAIASDNVQLYEAARLAEDEYRTLVEQIPAVMYRRSLEPTTDSLYVSPQIEQLLGYQADEWASTPFRNNAIHKSDRERVLGEIECAARSLEMLNVEYRLLTNAGATVWVRDVAHVVHDDAGLPLCWQGFIIDITRQRVAQVALQESEARFRSVVQHASDMVTIVDATGAVIYESPSVERVMGHTPQVLNNLGDTTGALAMGPGAHTPDGAMGSSSFAYPHPDDALAVGRAFAELRALPGADVCIEGRFPHRDGSWRTLEIIATNLLDDPSVAGIVVNARDITERKMLEAELIRQAFHDPLTELPNRVLFFDRLTQAIARADRSGGSIAVMFLDLDNFKLINDSLGHSFGDSLLIEVANRLRSSLRASDTVARLGGDEFMILLEEMRGLTSTLPIARKLLDAIRTPFTLDGRVVFTSASIGLTLREPHTATASDVLRNADVAMYRSKFQGKDRFEVFDPCMQAQAVQRLDLEIEVRRAIEKHEFVLHYQPKVALGTGEIAGVEALVRWQHPTRGLLAPLEFVPLAEETGLIVALGAWVLEESCRQAAVWNRLLKPYGRKLSVSVNLSARQFQDPALVERVEDALADSQLDPQWLTLELTESAVMVDPEAAAVTLGRIAAGGVRIAIDDFGTGYSSLTSLKRFPVDTLKIDRSFVDGLGVDPGDTAIVAATMSLAHALGLRVIAEGVETLAQLRHLRALGCELAQGYYFSKPLEATAIDLLLASHAWYDPAIPGESAIPATRLSWPPAS